MELSQVQ